MKMSMNNSSLAISGLGMIASPAVGQSLNYGAFACGYDNFEKKDFYEPYSPEKLICSGVSHFIPNSGYKRWLGMCSAAVEDCFKEECFPKGEKLSLFLCLPNTVKMPALCCAEDYDSIIKDVIDNSPLRTFHISVKLFFYDRCGFITALNESRNVLEKGESDRCLILGLDSLVHSKAIQFYGGDVYGNHNRLLTEDNSNGFIPGEAATAVLVSHPDKAVGNYKNILITGLGLSYEPAPYDSDDVLHAQGLVDASTKALTESNQGMDEMSFRMSSVSGEDYFFREAAIAQKKLLKTKVKAQPLWHPADTIGEVGAAIGGRWLSFLQTRYSMVRHLNLIQLFVWLVMMMNSEEVSS